MTPTVNWSLTTQRPMRCLMTIKEAANWNLTRPMPFSSSTKSRSSRNNYIEKLLNGIGTYSISLNSFTPKICPKNRFEDGNSNRDNKLTPNADNNRESLLTMEGIFRNQNNAAKAKKKNNNFGQFFDNDTDKNNNRESLKQKLEKDKYNVYNSTPDMTPVVSESKSNETDNKLDNNTQNIEKNEVVQENDDTEND